MYGSVYDVVEYFILYGENRAYIVRMGSRRTTNERATGNYLGNLWDDCFLRFMRFGHFISVCRCFPSE